MGNTTGSVTIPSTETALRSSGNRIGTGIELGEWTRAALVWAWVEPSVGGRPKNLPVSQQVSRKLSYSDFAALGIHGLKRRETVARYYRTWQMAIDEGLTSEVFPGESVFLPETGEFQAFYAETDTRKPVEDDPRPTPKIPDEAQSEQAEAVSPLPQAEDPEEDWTDEAPRLGLVPDRTFAQEQPAFEASVTRVLTSMDDLFLTADVDTDWVLTELTDLIEQLEARRASIESRYDSEAV